MQAQTENSAVPKAQTRDLFEDQPQPGLEFENFPKTRFQGSKRKLLRELADVFSPLQRGTVLDLFSGSGAVSLLLRNLGFSVVSNDYLRFANNTAHVFLRARPEDLCRYDWPTKLNYLLNEAPVGHPRLVSQNYEDVYFTDDENLQIDRFCQNIGSEDSFSRAVLTYGVGQALLMKRPYNLFHRANLYMRLQDVKRSFGNAATWGKPISKLALRNILELLDGPFDSNTSGHKITNVNTRDLSALTKYKASTIYIDPPYLASNGKAIDYADFYHFLEGLIEYSLFSHGDPSKTHRPIVSPETNWSTESNSLGELHEIARAWPDATLVLSYRDDGLPRIDDLVNCFLSVGRKSEIVPIRSYKYALSHSVTTNELIVIVKPSVAVKVRGHTVRK